MSDRMTEVAAPGVRALQLWGRKTRAEAIADFRRHLEREQAEIEKALATPDEELRVSTFLGPYARRNEREVTE